MLARLKKELNRALSPLGSLIAKTGLTPNQLTLMSLVFSAAFAVLSFQESQTFKLLGVVALAVASFLDFLDGMVARLTKRVSLRGAFLDSTIDRFSDACALAGLVGFKLLSPLEAYIGLVGFFMVSYTRARAEGLSKDIKIEGVGFMERAERLLGIFLSLLCAYLVGRLAARVIVLTVIALTYLTLIQRTWYILKKLSEPLGRGA